jgi:hypothetical protein
MTTMPQARGFSKTRVFQGFLGAGSGAGLYRNLVRFGAIHCKASRNRKHPKMNELCNGKQARAAPCKSQKNGLKIRCVSLVFWLFVVDFDVQSSIF